MTFGWSLPPGVTGTEDAFGPQHEFDEEREVEHECDEDKYEEFFKGTVTGTTTIWNTSVEFYFDCPQCDEGVTKDITDEYD